MRAVLFAVLFAFFQSVALAQSGNDLLRWCKEYLKEKDSNMWESGLCAGFIDGVSSGVDGMAMLSTPSFDQYLKRKAYCVPAGVTKGQTIRIVVQRLEELPASLHLDAGLLVIGALSKAFPCPK